MMKQLFVIMVLSFLLISHASIAISSSEFAIESQISGEFKGWEGETVVVLINGQIWKQSDYLYWYHYWFMPSVIVYKTRSGWKMAVEGVPQSVHVIRLK